MESRNKFPDPDPDDETIEQKDIICGKQRPLVRYCHIPGLNDPSNKVRYKFSPYSSFDAASANSVCSEFGGFLPHLETELDHSYLTEQMQNLLNLVTQGQPFSLRWMSWPVCKTLDTFYISNFLIFIIYTIFQITIFITTLYKHCGFSLYDLTGSFIIGLIRLPQTTGRTFN